jgi:hypothetical protein
VMGGVVSAVSEPAHCIPAAHSIERLADGFSAVGAGILDFFGRELSSHVGTCYAFVGTTFGGMPTRQSELSGTKPVTP